MEALYLDKCLNALQKICSWTESVKNHVMIARQRNISSSTPTDTALQKTSEWKTREWVRLKDINTKEKINKFSICSSCSFSLLMIQLANNLYNLLIRLFGWEKSFSIGKWKIWNMKRKISPFCGTWIVMSVESRI